MTDTLHRPPALRAAALALTALLAVLAALAWSPPPAAAAEQVRVVVKEGGFDPPVVNVTEGEIVELTFVYGDQHLSEDNPHIIFIEGLNIESGEISAKHPEAKVRFTAEKTGRILIKCTLYCHGHEKLQAGFINVRPAGAAGGQVVAQPTQMKLAVSNPDVAGVPGVLRAELTTRDGQPIEGVTVHFQQQANLINAGWIALGTARTDARGVAVFQYRPFGTSLEAPVRAAFEGSARYEPANGAAILKAVELVSGWHQEAGVRVPGLGYWLLWTVLGTMWAIFASVIYQVLRLRETAG